MLKRRGAHFRPVPERRCRSRLTLEAAGGETGSGAAGGSSARLQPSAASFPTAAPPRETAALQEPRGGRQRMSNEHTYPRYMYM